jgi:hypothetical protein
VIERLLRDRDAVWRQIIEERDLRGLTGQMLSSSAVSLAIYGAVLGASNGWAQALSSLVKLPLLFLATLTICLPTLYLFNLVFGARLSMMQAVTLILVSVTVTSVLTLAFAPISLFFLISAHSYPFFKLLNVCILVLTAVVGLRFLIDGMRALNEHQARLLRESVAAPAFVEPVAVEAVDLVPELVAAGAVAASAPNGGTAAISTTIPPPPGLPGQPQRVPAPQAAAQGGSMTLLYIWILLFGFVGTQLGWTLRPFFGDPDRPFALFRHISGTFYADILHTIGRLFSG